MEHFPSRSCVPRRRRRLLPAVLACIAPALGAADGQVLAYHGRAAAEAVHLLVAISAGDAATVATIDPATWHTDAAIPDPADGARGLRWSRCIPAALDRCPGPARAGVLAAIDAAFQRERERDPLLPDGHIADYLPSPGATELLRLRSAAAMDRGAWLSALAGGRLIPAAALGSSGATRLRVAEAESGMGASPDPALALPAPGDPIAATALTPTPVQGLSVRWTCVPGWILASRLGRVDWQYRVAMDAEVVAGAGGALVRDADGLRLLDEEGHVRTFPSPPGDTRLLAVAGGAGWFAVGERVWRLPLAGGPPQVLALDAAPLGPPLVRGAQSLWLLPERLVLAQEDRVVARMRHHLAVDGRWRLCLADAVTPALVAPDGSTWHVPPLADQLSAAKPLDQARLLLAAGRPDEALARVQAPLDEAARSVAFACHLGLGPVHVAAEAPQVAALAGSEAERAAVWCTAWRHADPTTRQALAPQAQTALAHARFALVGWTDEDLGVAPERWWHASQADILLHALEHRSQQPQGRIDLAAPLVPTTADADDRPSAPPFREAEDPVLGHVHWCDDALLTLNHAAGVTTLACYGEKDHGLRWRTRWRCDRQVPSRALALDARSVVVAEGLSDLVILDSRTGAIRLRVVTTDLSADPDRTCVSDGVVAMAGPLDDRLGIAQADPVDGTDGTTAHIARMATIALPARLRWMVPLPDGTGVLAVLGDGSARHYPGGEAVAVPAALAGSATRPDVMDDALILRAPLHGCWAWRWVGDPAHGR